MTKAVTLTTEYMRGWNAKEGEFPIFDLTPGDGISINQGVISIAPVTGVAGTYSNPLVTIDTAGRISSIQDGAVPSALKAAVLNTPDEIDTYTGSADSLIVLDAGNGRSGLYIKESEGAFVGPAFITGERGIDGLSGADGADGAKGDKGETGERGPEGPQGLRGPQGEAGASGSDGFNGSEGPQGPQGPTGPMGSFLTPDAYGNLDEDRIAFIRTHSGNYFFLVNPSGDLRSNNLIPSGISGDMSLHLIGWNGSIFTDYGQLTGAQGPQGIQGVQGTQGERGPQGVQGERGLQGIEGAAGPRGIAGINGVDGARGLTGLQGNPGVQGVQGERGLQGLDGPRGLQGLQGLQGEQGERGDSGFRGGAMYATAISGARVTLNSNFNPVDVNRVVYNIGGYNFRPSGTADNAIVIPQGVSLVRFGYGIGFTGSIVIDTAYHFSIRKNGLFAYPGCPAILGKFPYSTPRVSSASGVLSVVPGDIFTLVFATSGTGERIPSEHTFWSIEVLG